MKRSLFDCDGGEECRPAQRARTGDTMDPAVRTALDDLGGVVALLQGQSVDARTAITDVGNLMVRMHSEKAELERKVEYLAGQVEAGREELRQVTAEVVRLSYSLASIVGGSGLDQRPRYVHSCQS